MAGVPLAEDLVSKMYPRSRVSTNTYCLPTVPRCSRDVAYRYLLGTEPYADLASGVLRCAA